MFEKIKKNNRGVTLVELLTALAILGIVLSVAFSMFLFGNKVFAKGTSQYVEQTDLRFANDYIVKEARYATTIELLSSAPGIIDDSDQYDYIYIDGNTLVHSGYNSGSARIVETVLSDVLASSSFATSLNADSQTLEISLFGQEKDQLYDLQTSISLPNININKEFAANSSNMKTIKFIVDMTLDGSGTPSGGGGGSGGTEPPQTFVTATVSVKSKQDLTYRITLDSTVVETTGTKSPYEASFTVAANATYTLKVENITGEVYTVFDDVFEVDGVNITKEINDK